MMGQIENLLPDEMKEHSLAAWKACKALQQTITDKFERIFKLTKCFYEYNPQKFVFP